MTLEIAMVEIAEGREDAFVEVLAGHHVAGPPVIEHDADIAACGG